MKTKFNIGDRAWVEVRITGVHVDAVYGETYDCEVDDDSFGGRLSGVDKNMMMEYTEESCEEDDLK